MHTVYYKLIISSIALTMTNEETIYNIYSKEITHYEFQKNFYNICCRNFLISNILNLTHIFNNDNSHDYSISVSSDDEIDELSK